MPTKESSHVGVTWAPDEIPRSYLMEYYQKYVIDSVESEFWDLYIFTEHKHMDAGHVFIMWLMKH